MAGLAAAELVMAGLLTAGLLMDGLTDEALSSLSSLGSSFLLSSRSSTRFRRLIMFFFIRTGRCTPCSL